MSEEKVCILLVDGDGARRARVGEMLSGGVEPGAFTFAAVDRLALAIEHLAAKRCDVIVASLNLPDSRGLDTFYALLSKAQERPIIVLAGSADEMLAINAMQAGASAGLSSMRRIFMSQRSPGSSRHRRWPSTCPRWVRQAGRAAASARSTRALVAGVTT
jgi:CheY-like chemotaxis protein